MDYNGNTKNGKDTTTMKKRYDGSLLSKEETAMLAERIIVTTHATLRIKERCPGINLTRAILDSPLVYWSKDGYIVVSLPKGQSLIVDSEFRLVTLRNPSANMYSNADKWLITRWRATTGRRCYG